MDTTQLNNLFTINPTTVSGRSLRLQPVPKLQLQQEPRLQSGRAWDSTQASSNSIPAAFAQFPYISMSSMSVLGVSDNNSYYVHASDNFSASVDKELGKHSLKMGFDYRKIKAAGNDANDPNFSFSGIFTQSINTSSWNRRGGSWRICCWVIRSAARLIAPPSSQILSITTALYSGSISRFQEAHVECRHALGT